LPTQVFLHQADNLLNSMIHIPHFEFWTATLALTLHRSGV
jgi:hypothetical protein